MVAVEEEKCQQQATQRNRKLDYDISIDSQLRASPRSGPPPTHEQLYHYEEQNTPFW